jgi:pimeloyl-ACP methyl ester carboxylesterase
MIFKSQLTISDLTFDLRTAGKESNEAVILLHGFPETSHMWTPLMIDLIKEGFYCIAPNQRGYSRDAKPKGKQNYTIDKLGADIIQIAKVLNIDKFHLIGHDWGAIVGWYLSNQFLELILSWSASSVPHLQAFGEAIVNDPIQKRMSAYVRHFQFPWLPEFMIKRSDHKLLRRLWENSSKEEVDDYLSVFREHGTVVAALNYYRGNYQMLKSAGTAAILGDVHVPTLFIWGEADPAIGYYGVEKCQDHVKGDYNFVKVKGGHWLVQTNYDEVASSVITHLKKNRKTLNSK